MKIIEVLRLSEQGYSQREIAAGVNCSKSTVGEVQKRCRAASIGYEQAKGMGDDELRAKLYPRAGGRPEKAEPEWVSIQKKLDSSKRLTLQYVWEEYRIAYPDGLCRSQFCERYRKWRQQSGREVVMVQEREPGKELFVDWKKPCALAHIKSFRYSPARQGCWGIGLPWWLTVRRGKC